MQEQLRVQLRSSISSAGTTDCGAIGVKPVLVPGLATTFDKSLAIIHSIVHCMFTDEKLLVVSALQTYPRVLVSLFQALKEQFRKYVI